MILQATEKLIREDLQEFSAYSSARSLNVSGEIWLNANESPYNDKYLYNRYPEPQPQALVDRLAKIYGINNDEILVTRGSDEGIDLIFRLYCQYQKDSVLALEPTFGMYKVAARLQGVAYKTVRLTSDNDFEIDVDGILEAIEPSCKLLFLCTPNNPTGRSIAQADIEAILKKLDGRCVVVVDEAYVEYSNYDSATKLINKYENIVVLRTLSKSFGMAGLRLGVAISNKYRIAWLKKILAPYPVPKTTESIILELLKDDNLLKIEAQIQEIQVQRGLVYNFLVNLAIANKVYASDANFILVEFKQDIFKKLMDNGIVVRSMAGYFGDEKFLRISIGTVVENKKLMQVLQQISDEYEAK